MLKPEDVVRAVELQQRSYALLRWVVAQVDRGTLGFKVAHDVSSLPEAAYGWLDRNYETLPRDSQPSRKDLRAFANLFASYLESSFDLVEAPGRQLYSPDAHCFCPMCSYFIDAPRLTTKKVSRNDKERARGLQATALREVARDRDRELTDADIAELLSNRGVFEAAALVAYADELIRRMDDRGSGPVGLALWRSFAWTAQGSPKPDFELTAPRILEAQGHLAQALDERANTTPRWVLVTHDDALELLAELGADARLVRHHELVVEAAEQLCDRLDARFDRRHVLLGAALHDCGKILHPEEMREHGAAHEHAGQQLLLEHGIAPAIARFCVTHAAWAGGTIEDMLVALADKLWKGKRDEALELAISEHIAEERGGDRWAVMARVDAICEEIAGDGPARLARSDV